MNYVCRIKNSEGDFEGVTDIYLKVDKSLNNSFNYEGYSFVCVENNKVYAYNFREGELFQQRHISYIVGNVLTITNPLCGKEGDFRSLFNKSIILEFMTKEDFYSRLATIRMVQELSK